MYVEHKADGVSGPARIGRVLELRSLKGAGFKANYFDVNTGEHYWISVASATEPIACTTTAVPSKSTRTRERSTGRRFADYRTQRTERSRTLDCRARERTAQPTTSGVEARND